MRMPVTVPVGLGPGQGLAQAHALGHWPQAGGPAPGPGCQWALIMSQHPDQPPRVPAAAAAVLIQTT